MATLKRTPDPVAPAKQALSASALEPAASEGEWAPLEPTEKDMGLVRIVLDRGVTTTVIGHVYGLDFEIEGKGFAVSVYYDHYNRRLKVLHYRATDYRAMVERLAYLAEANRFDKVFLKARQDDWQQFLGLGFVLEGILKYFFCGEDAYVLSRFGSLDRITSKNLIDECALIEKLTKVPRGYSAPELPPGYELIVAREEHISKMVRLYRRVFKTYPSPLTHPDFIKQTMRRNVVYGVVLNPRDEVVSAASADIDRKHANAEMTDCATSRGERGKALMHHILFFLERKVREEGVVTAYTLARSQSVGMNRVFYRLGYEYSGRLLNNCDIFGDYEDMNIWVKRLATEGEP